MACELCGGTVPLSPSGVPYVYCNSCDVAVNHSKPIQENDNMNRMSPEVPISEDNLPHVTQITLTDDQLAFVTNAVQFVAISLKRHPEAATKESWLRNMAAAFGSLDSFPQDVFVSTVNMFQNAADSLAGDERYIPLEPNKPSDKPEGKDIPQDGGKTWCSDCGDLH